MSGLAEFETFVANSGGMGRDVRHAAGRRDREDLKQTSISAMESSRDSLNDSRALREAKLGHFPETCGFLSLPYCPRPRCCSGLH